MAPAFSAGGPCGGIGTTELPSRWVRIFGTLVLLAAAPLNAGPAHAGTSADRDFVEAKLATVMWGQYMAQHCQPSAIAGWSGFPTVACRYRTRFGAVPVVMLNADNGRLAIWLVTACQDAGMALVRECAERIAVQIQCQSGNQFPISGFVDEGALYLFRDGVTVSIEGFTLGECAGLLRAPTAQEESLAQGRGAVSTVCKFARVSGTSRSQFVKFAHISASDVADLRWQSSIREEYQAAWSMPRNRLISAWASDNSANLGPQTSFEIFFSSACPKGVRWARWF